MRLFQCSQCGCQMNYIGNYQYQCPNCGDVADYSELANGAKKICKSFFNLLKNKEYER